MKFRAYISILIIFTVQILQLNAKNWWLQVKAVSLTKDSFADIVGKDKHVIIEFFTPWCIYCQHMANDWNKLYDHYQRAQTRDDVVIAKLNCDDEGEFCAEHHVHSFPTIKHYPKGKQVAEAHHHGPRNFENFKMWIENSCGKEEKVEEQKLKTEPKKEENQDKNQTSNNNKQQEQNKTQAIKDSDGLFQEIKSQLEDGLADLPQVVHNVEIRHFHKMNQEEKTDVLFDQVHSIKREMQELNTINDKNLLLLNKIIKQADKLQDERIVLQDKIKKINNQIDLKKDQIINIAKQLQNEEQEHEKQEQDGEQNQKQKQQKIDQKEEKNMENLHKIQENVEKGLKERKSGEKNTIKIWQFIAVLFAGASVGFLATILIHQITNRKKSYENEEESFKMN